VHTNIIHNKMVDSLTEFFSETCDIQSFNISLTSEYNVPEKSWSDVYSGIACAIGEDTGQEVKQDDKTVRRSTHRIVLKGVYDVDKTMRVVIGNRYFDILYVSTGSRDVKTSLICEEVSV